MPMLSEEQKAIRKASRADSEGICRLLEIVELPTDGVVEIVDHFLVWKSTLGEEMEPTIRGCIGLEVYGNNALLRSLAVHPIYQRQGIGTKLTHSVIQYARKLGINTLFLLTETAQGFFERHEFSVTSREEVPESVQQSVEFRYVCPSSAVCMSKSI